MTTPPPDEPNGADRPNQHADDGAEPTEPVQDAPATDDAVEPVLRLLSQPR